MIDATIASVAAFSIFATRMHRFCDSVSCLHVLARPNERVATSRLPIFCVGPVIVRIVKEPPRRSCPSRLGLVRSAKVRVT